MTLTSDIRELVHKFGTDTDIRLWEGVHSHEQEFGRPLPPSAFYKMVQRNIETRIRSKAAQLVTA